MNPLTHVKKVASVFLVAWLCFGLLPTAQAISPSPDGCYPGGNTAEGCNALLSLTTGTFNTAVGFDSLLSNTDANFNTGVGAGTLLLNTAGENTAVGAAALLSNTTGINNTGDGAFALFSNTTGLDNTAVGDRAMQSNIDGSRHTAVGSHALFNCVAAPDFAGNTAVGTSALFSDTTGNFNTAIGDGVLFNNTTGAANTAIGASAGINVATADNVICIGNPGADVSNTTWIGNVFGVTTVSGTTAAVIVSDTGQLGTLPSSERFKKDIATMAKTSEAILALRPVTFHYKSDAKGTPQFGLIAEEVAKVNPALVLPDKEGKPYTVRYEAVNAMLLNEFLKEHRKNEEQETTIAQLKSGMDALVATVKEQASQIQKVSAQLEASKPPPQVVNNP